MPQSGSGKVIKFPSQVCQRCNAALSLLQHRPHHATDDVLIALAIAALEGLAADRLVELEADLTDTPKAGA